jgi:hypothetical protein
MRIEGIRAYEEGGTSALKDVMFDELYNIGAKTSIILTGALFPSAFTQLARLPTALRGGLTIRGFFGTYGGNFTPFPGLGMIAAGELYSRYKRSSRQDVTSATSAGQTPKTRGGTKSSRGAKSPQTLKPFWSNGKPKCRKGYRYDFKRKMCVKKS